MRNESLTIQIVSAIKTKCKERHLKISELLRTVGTTQHLIADWQNGRCEPSFPVLGRICQVLNIAIVELFGDEQLQLTDSQKSLLADWRELSPSEKQALFTYIDAMKSNH